MTNNQKTFETMDNEIKQDVENSSAKTTNEMDWDTASDKAAGDQTKYVRESIVGKKVKIKNFQVFLADTNEQPKKTQSGDKEYYPITTLITYDIQNADGLDHREYLSGGRQWVQKDKTLSAPQFWYKGSPTATADLWELVAESLGKQPDEISIKEFGGYLNGQRECDIKGFDVKNFNAPKGQPAMITKNVPGKFY